MKTIFLGMVTFSLAILGAAFLTAYLPPTWRLVGFGQVTWHMLLGLAAGLILLSLHTFVILNYFIATGKSMLEATAGHPFWPEVKRRTRKLKARTFPFATMSAIFIIAAAVLGGLAYKSGGHAAHWIMAWIALLFNLFSFKMEYKSILLNMALIEEVRAVAIARAREAKAAKRAEAQGGAEAGAEVGEAPRGATSAA